MILLPAIIVPLWVPLYDKADPRLNGWPFFFWFQMALIVFATTLTVIAFMLSAGRRPQGPRGPRPADATGEQR